MGPRRIRRGKPARIPRPGESSTGFNGATANPPWKTVAPSRYWACSMELQWGHGESAVENGARISDIATGQTSFNGATANPPWKTFASASSRRHGVALQWGHGESAVENCEA